MYAFIVPESIHHFTDSDSIIAIVLYNMALLFVCTIPFTTLLLGSEPNRNIRFSTSPGPLCFGSTDKKN